MTLGDQGVLAVPQTCVSLFAMIRLSEGKLFSLCCSNKALSQV